MKFRLITEWSEGKEYPQAIYLVRERSRLGRMVWYCVGEPLEAAKQQTERMNSDPDYAAYILSIDDEYEYE